jgi:signal transduction histidine kinase/CheY-like chemotaxis protein
MNTKKIKSPAISKASPCGIKRIESNSAIKRLKQDLQNFYQHYVNAPIGCFSVGVEGVIMASNFMGASMLGLSLEQAIGSNFVDHVIEADRAAFHEFFDMISQHGVALPCLVCLNNSNGGVIFVTLTGVKLPNENFCHVTATDTTKLFNAQSELKRTQDDLDLMVQKRTGKLRSLARELTLAEERERRRIAGLVHDNLQQLLVAVLLNIGATKAKNQNRRLLEELESIELMTKECVEITRSLAAELSPSVLHQCGLAAGFGWLRDWFREKYGFNLEVSADEALRPDEDISITLFQCVREIVFNSVKHSGVKAACLTMAYDCDAFVNISIKDQGAGFDADALGLHDAWKGGFGLFSVRERVELLGGVMLIESALGQGACFTLRFPATVFSDLHAGNHCEKTGGGKAARDEVCDDISAAEVPMRTRLRTSDEMPRIRVVLADDHSMVRQGLVRVFLDEADFEIVGEAADGKEALELARELHPDVIVMDLQMPVMSGLEATRAIRKELPEVQVIGLSMDANKEYRRSLRRAGALDLLHKGGSAEDLIQRVREHLVAKA